MVTLIIDGIDDVLENEIKIKVEKFGLSQSETVKKILSETLKSDKTAERLKMFEPFCGLWTKSNVVEFNEVIKDLNTINPYDWE